MLDSKAQASADRLPEIKGFLETSFIDWPGKIAAVLFLPGCNFACPYCHNHQLAEDPDSLLTLALDEVLDRLKLFVGWIDGVVISGGEPTIHPGLPRLAAMLKNQGFLVKLDTNGSRPQVVKELVRQGLVDMVAMDLKAPLDPLAYRRAAGRSVEVRHVQESLDFLKESGLAHEIRSTIWPLWHGSAELGTMAEEVCGAQKWTLQALDPQTAWNPQALGTSPPYGSEVLYQLQASLADPACRPD